MKGFCKLLLLVFLITGSVSAQESFHRTFNTFNNSSLLNVSGLQLNDGSYLSMDLLLTPAGDTVIIDSLVITNYKPKGDPIWSQRIRIISDDANLTANQASMVQGANDSIYFSLTTTSEDKPDKIIGAIDNTGSMGWVKRLSTIENGTEGVGLNLLAVAEQSLYAAYGTENGSLGDLVLSKLDYSGDVLFSKAMRAFNGQDSVSSFVTAVHTDIEKNLLFTGIADSTAINAFLLRTDTSGNVLWSRRFEDVENLISIPVPTGVTMLADTSVVMAGYYFAITNNFQFILNGFVMRTDKNGEIIWSKKLAFDIADVTFIKQVTTNRAGTEILLYGVNQEAATANNTQFAARLDSDGGVIWQKKFPRVNGNPSELGALRYTQDGGAVIFDSSVDGDKLATGIIKLDPNGASMCEENINETIFFDHSFVSDTLVWVVRDTGYSDNVMASAQEFNLDYQALTLNTRPFCPNEPIDWTFRTPVSGATLYEWSTGVSGPMMDTLRVFEEGSYHVTVTVNDRVCYKLCDTTQINRFTLPMISITESLGTFCTTGEMLLIGTYTPGNPSVESITWSNGQTGVFFINVPQPGNYTVTLTDRCNETAMANYQLGPFPTKLSAVTINKNFSEFCNNATGILSAVGNATGAVANYTYLWSNGQTTQNISVAQPGTYTVTVTDFCGTQVVQSITLPQSDFPTLSLNSLTSALANFCTDNGARLTLSFNGESSLIEWSTGARNTNSIVVTQTGTYSVTVSERTCPNNRITASINFVLPEEYDLITEVTLSTGPDQNVPCERGFVLVRAEYDGFARSIVWSSGASNTNVISINDYKEYTVTVQDFCNTFERSIQVEAPELRLIYANAFFPETLDTMTMERNKTFGPFVRGTFCEGAVQDYEFLIFNRWGQKLFETNLVTEEWDGRFNGQLAPAEVYVWRARYTAYGIEHKVGGDVSLLRISR
jgi:gliding motility-associated-like protein